MNDIFCFGLSNKIDNSKYCLFWKSYDIYRVAFFNNRLKLNNFIIQYDIKNYTIRCFRNFRRSK